MTGLIPILALATVIALRLLFLVKQLWRYPLNHGSGYFFGVVVEEGFYEGRGSRWLRAYRAILLFQLAILLGTGAVIAVLGRWSDMPIVAPVDVGSFFLLIGGFVLWARHRVAPPTRPVESVAVSLQPRALSDYLSWRSEGLLLAVIAGCWAALVAVGGDVALAHAAVSTYAVIGLLPAEILLVRRSFPLPADRAEEHERWFDGWRRHSLHVIEGMRWFLALMLSASTTRLAAPSLAWLPWVLMAAALVVFGGMMVELIRGSERLQKQGRSLRPVGSWSSPFGPPRMMLRGWLPWTVVYCGGLAALMVLFGR